MIRLFKRESEKVNDILGNDSVKKLLDKFIENDLSRASAIIIIWEERGDRKQTYWDSGGIEPAQAILTMDQLHHRIQHEGLKKYE